MSKYDDNSDHQLNDLHAEVGALKLIIKELVHMIDEDKLKGLKKQVSLNKVHELLYPNEMDKGVINSKANRIARSLIDKVITEKNNP
ncbi:hypothetical protein LT980_07535 [Citrobacter portucalensis]|uniref:hypothetical protein n=1 Tax=Citrobacter freundii complex TaxID=1344959 RepID=UPI00081A5544|nr:MULTISPECIES: hypothetical protein [Citrobacter freundii complex]ANZ86810.1 hypothetical protein CfB38_1889 [Citrobacter freundii]URR14428.1 hypothetical protein LT980_07535 [Citrobacter portucalensis]